MIIKYGLSGMVLFLLMVFSVDVSVGQQDLGKIKRICIDAGHGGKDPGAVGAKAYEKNIVLSVALKLGKQIEKAYPDIKVVYIRKTDVFVELTERTRIAKSQKADLFISIHANSLDVKKNPKGKVVRGVETYVLGANNSEHNLQVAMKENSVIHYEDNYSMKYEGFDPSRAESYILFSMLRNVHQDKSMILASMIQDNLVKTTSVTDRGVCQGPLWVLKDVAMPAVLVEVGYISNPDEERFMASESGQTKIVNGIFKGFQAYKERVEKKVALNIENTMPERHDDAEQSKAEEVAGDSLVYAVQVASGPNPVQETSELCPGYKVNELKCDDRYRYYVAPSADYGEVRGKMSKVKSQVKDCFIIAIYKGRLISVSEARKLERK
ncbi:MAG: N-acetylmuramoyl-L-alanine amidase [Odoribacter sp.]|nr:N-acetylmuramoyl-L-alanine amidase [Odoribacter sp.]